MGHYHVECRGKLNEGTPNETVCEGHFDIFSAQSMDKFMDFLHEHIKHSWKGSGTPFESMFKVYFD